MIAHRGSNCFHVLEARGNVVLRPRLSRSLELVAPHVLGAAGSALQSEDVFDRLDVKVNVEMVMSAGQRLRQSVERTGREDDANGLRDAGLDIRITGHRAVAELGGRAK